MVDLSFDYSGQVAFVTGASVGIGHATATAFARSGASVMLADVNSKRLGAAVDELRSAGHDVHGVVTDVTDEDQVAASVAKTVETFGRLDIAFNNAGVQVAYAGSAEEEAIHFDRVNAVNYRGVWAAMKHELLQMRTQSSGTIVNTSSIGGMFGGPGRAAYHASKHAVIGLTKSAAREYAPRGIRVNAVLPGTIDTPMVDKMFAAGDIDRDDAIAAIPLGRLGRPEEIASVVLWLSSPGASFLTGVTLLADGGQLA